MCKLTITSYTHTMAIAMASSIPKHSLLSSIITSLFWLSFINLSFAENLCNPSDKNILLGIKSHFNNASVFTTWDTNTNCCNTWLGIECDKHGRVMMLQVSDADDVIGEFPSSIGDLSSLIYLTFAVFPHVSGPIPQTLAKLKLNHIDFSLNNLTGPIPDFISQFTDLNGLDLSGNSLSGPIPSSLGRLTKLAFVNLGQNKLSGPIPASLGRIKSLVQLYLYINNFTGPLPSSLASLPLLNELSVFQNQITGPIPASFGSFKNPALQLDFSNNLFSGPIPAEFGQANITALDLSNNKFSGNAAFLFGRDKTVLNSIVLSNNQLNFDFSKVDLSPGLKKLDISHNMIFGSLPKELGQLPLQTLDVSFNQLCGQIPTGRRLKQFSPVKFSNNKCLCGAPLPSCN